MSARHIERWLDEARYAATLPGVRVAALAAGVTALLLGAVLATAWLPTRHRYTEHLEAVQGLRAEMRRSRQAAEVLEAYRSGNEAVRDWEARLAAGASRGGVVSGVAGLAQHSGLTLLGQALHDDTLPDGLRTLRQDLVLDGPYEGMKAFLAGLRKLPSWTEVRTAQLESAASRGGRVRATVRLVTYRGPAREAP